MIILWCNTIEMNPEFLFLRLQMMNIGKPITGSCPNVQPFPALACKDPLELRDYLYDDLNNEVAAN